jgi:REP element-mobilizing transposase RayT
VHRRFRKSSLSRDERYKGHHRFEHWYLDNCVYFITARCRDRFPAFASDAAKSVFWDRFTFCTAKYGFVPWATSLIDNHYHTIGYLKVGENLGPMMQRFHGSVAKLVNDLLSKRLRPFWYDSGKQGYFDGCIRDELQARRGYRYILRQSERHGIMRDWRKYPHTRVNVELERAIKRALELNAFLTDVPYQRYAKRDRDGSRRKS